MNAKIIKGRVILGVFLILSLSITGQTPSKSTNTYALKKIVIDAGHGGKDGGCHGTSAKEKNIALGIALQLGRKITTTYPDVQVIYTRKKDQFIPLHRRAEIANKNKADLFISIHCNAVPRRTTKGLKVNGTETYVLGLHRAADNLEVVKRENQVITLEDDYHKHYSGFDPNSPESHIMSSIFQGAHLDQSISLASKIEAQFKTTASRSSRGVKQAGFMVLRETTMPSVLIEAGFLTNTTEEKFLSTKAGQTKMATAIFNAFKSYKAEVEGKELAADLVEKSIIRPEAPKGAPISMVAVYEKGAPKRGEDIFEENGLLFKVQLAASSSPIKAKHPLKIKVPELEINQTGTVYKYTVGRFQTYKACLMALSEYRAKGFKDAFIVAYNNGQPIPLVEARKKERSR